MAQRKMTKAEVSKMLGPPPTFDGPVDRSQLMDAYNYFSASQTENSTLKGYVSDWIDLTGLKANIGKIPDWEFSHLGANCYIMCAGGILPDGMEAKTRDAIVALTKKYKTDRKAVTGKPAVQRAIDNKANDVIATVDDAIDSFVMADYKDTGFQAVGLLTSEKVKPAVAKVVSDFYRPLLKEIQDAAKGKDDQLNEAYGAIGQRKLNRYVAFLKKLVNDIDTFTNEQKVMVPKPVRRKKATTKVRTRKTPAKLISNVKYLKESKEYGLTSISPIKVIGAKQVWLFNTKTRVLTMLNAKGADGLTITGTTVKNFDVETSKTKKVRKPEQVIERVLKEGKVALRKLIPELTTKESVTNGRLNGDTVIVRVF